MAGAVCLFFEQQSGPPHDALTGVQIILGDLRLAWLSDSITFIAMREKSMSKLLSALVLAAFATVGAHAADVKPAVAGTTVSAADKGAAPAKKAKKAGKKAKKAAQATK
jgi:hypothetical protein